jgi:ABC-type phosphate transport system substrate-binding protein
MRNATGSPKRWAKLGLTGGLAVAAAVGLVVSTAGPAAADPATTYVAVGSDTIQDVMNQFSVIVGGGSVGSWDAVNPGSPTVTHDEINPKSGCSMTRPNGSGEGLSALRKSVNPATAAAVLADPPEPGCVDFARSSGGPGGNQSDTGQLVYVPFALDAVAPATGPAVAAGGAVATAITHADDFTSANLVALYACTTITVDGVSYVPDGTTTNATTQPVHLYVPQPGSGTRSFWATTLSFNGTTLPSCVHDTSVVTAVAVQEHDGTVFAGDADALGPFSIAQFVSQTNGHNDRRHNAAIHSLNAIAPLTGTSLNTAYPITREVYNIVKLSRITTGSADFDAGLTSLLSGGSSLLCGQSLTIRSFGFATLAAAPLGHTCGQVATNLRAFATV